MILLGKGRTPRPCNPEHCLTLKKMKDLKLDVETENYNARTMAIGTRETNYCGFLTVLYQLSYRTCFKAFVPNGNPTSELGHKLSACRECYNMLSSCST